MKDKIPDYRTALRRMQMATICDWCWVNYKPHHPHDPCDDPTCDCECKENE